MRGANTGGVGQPAEGIEFILNEECSEASRRMFRGGERRVAAVIENGAEALMIGLVETVLADLQTISRKSRAQTDLSSDIAGGAVLRGGHGKICWLARVVRRVVDRKSTRLNSSQIPLSRMPFFS